MRYSCCIEFIPVAEDGTEDPVPVRYGPWALIGRDTLAARLQHFEDWAAQWAAHSTERGRYQVVCRSAEFDTLV